MRKEKVFLIISVILIFSLLLLTNFQKPIFEGKVTSIKVYTSSTAIYLESSKEEIIYFDKLPPNLQNKNLKIYGERQINKNETQIIADKIICINC
jgi:hypothetical protein